ncbi:MAG TPA: phosphatidylglycerophosphatase A [Limnobacter sp.]|nr:phosphatidylglycerophosphatase A [Limnobacter sp.]
MLSHPAHLLSFGLGSGLAWFMPGTFGTLMGWLLFVWINPRVSTAQWCLLIAVAFLVGIWACRHTGRTLGVVDHGSIVWDEIVSIWIVLLVAGAHYSTPVQQLWCVIVFRFFDMVKPPPIRWFDRQFKSGFGVMLDDVVAAFFTLLALAFWAKAAS